MLISPDGSPQPLPFGALPGKTPGTYLIEERAFAVVPVPQLIPQLVQEEGRKQLRKKLLLLGNVDYDAEPNKTPDHLPAPSRNSPQQSASHRSADFGPLPGTESEIAAIEELYRHEVGCRRSSPR